MINFCVKNLGIFIIIEFIFLLFKKLNNSIRTEIMSDEAFEFLQDKENRKRLGKEIEFYKKNGYWRINGWQELRNK